MSAAPANPDCAERPRTIYVDPAVLEATLTRRESPPRPAPVVIRVDDELEDIRGNVRDAAKAVLTWLASVTTPDSGVIVDDVLARCLRPGPDVERINFTALAKEINQVLGVDLSPKRVRTAIQHLRHARLSKEDKPQHNLKKRLDALAERLERNYQNLTADETADRPILRRELATAVLAALRSAAGRLIDNDFGEGIPDRVNLDELASRYRAFVRRVFREGPGSARSLDLSRDLRRLLVTLCDYDGTAESDMRLVMDGTRVVCAMMGTGSLPGVLARLNVLVAGRGLLDTELYVDQLRKLADDAATLHDDPATRSYLNWARRLPEDARVPSPLRVASYCLNNAATRVLERLFLGQLEGGHWLNTAEDAIAIMHRQDAGFRLLKITRAIHHTVIAHLTGDRAGVETYFSELGEDKAVDVLVDLARFDNCPAIVTAVRRQAERVLPEVANQVIHVG